MSGNSSGGPHPNVYMPNPALLQLSQAAPLSGTGKTLQEAVPPATSLLLAGEAFLASSRDDCKSLELRVRLEQAGLDLIEAALAHTATILAKKSRARAES